MATSSTSKYYEVIDILSKTGSKYRVKWRDGSVSVVELNDLQCPDLLLQFEVKRQSTRSRARANVMPEDFHIFVSCVCVQWTKSDVELINLCPKVAAKLKELKSGAIQKINMKTLTPSGHHSAAELGYICPVMLDHIRQPEKSIVTHSVLPDLPTPNSIALEKSILRVMIKTLVKSSFTYLIINCLTYSLEKLGKNGYSIQPQIPVAESFREDFAILKVLNHVSTVVAFIEVAVSVHPILSKVDLSKLCEALLYVYYHLCSQESTDPVFSILTDSYTYHIFKVQMNRLSKLEVITYYKFTTSDEDICQEGNLEDCLSNILKFCSMI